jgi:hypothetical protein
MEIHVDLWISIGSNLKLGNAKTSLSHGYSHIAKMSRMVAFDNWMRT